MTHASHAHASHAQASHEDDACLFQLVTSVTEGMLGNFISGSFQVHTQHREYPSPLA